MVTKQKNDSTGFFLKRKVDFQPPLREMMKKPAKFRIQTGGLIVSVIFESESLMFAIAKIPSSKQLRESLIEDSKRKPENFLNFRIVSDDLNQEFRSWRQALADASSKIQSVVFDYTNQESAQPKAFSYFWSIDQENWNPVNMGYWAEIGLGVPTISQSPSFDETAVKNIQSLLNKRIQTLEIALPHLKRAVRQLKQGESNRMAIIESCMAAEIGIKEFFSIHDKGRLFQIFEHLPSPPLKKMYGDVLKHYAKEDCTFLGDLNDLSEKRNKLIHTPVKDTPTQLETSWMVKTGECAVAFLHKILNKNNRVMANRYQKLEQELKELHETHRKFMREKRKLQ